MLEFGDGIGVRIGRKRGREAVRDNPICEPSIQRSQREVNMQLDKPDPISTISNSVPSGQRSQREVNMELAKPDPFVSSKGKEVAI